MNATEQRAPELQWPEGYPRTAPAERESYPGNISLTRKESFESIVDVHALVDGAHLVVEISVGKAIDDGEDRPPSSPEVGPPAPDVLGDEQREERQKGNDDRPPDVDHGDRIGSDASQRVGSVV